VRALAVKRLKHTVTPTVQAAKGCLRQLRLPTIPSGGTCMTTYMLHKTLKPKSKLNFVTLDKESDMSKLWRRTEFLRICIKEDLAE